MNVRLLLVCSILAIAPLSGCIGDDSDSSNSESMCAGGVADQELIDIWTQYTDPDLTPREMHIRSNLEKTGYIQNDDFASTYCWTA